MVVFGGFGSHRSQHNGQGFAREEIFWNYDKMHMISILIIGRLVLKRPIEPKFLSIFDD